MYFFQEAQLSLSAVDEELAKLQPMVDHLEPLESPRLNYQQLKDHHESVKQGYGDLISEMMVELEEELQLQQLGTQISAQLSKSNQEILKVCFF